ncbi:MAG: PBP1A family penicillin-binding protein [Pyrinomonadaceae bacterium]|nr:PBP1A family penicillin-binding protein [Pyrinomonadaceae bacterium]
MPIEVTSLPRQAGIRSLRKFLRRVLARALHPLAYSFRHAVPLSKRQLLLRSVPGLLAIALVAGGDTLLRSYKYYSRIIDARLASGYLTSRPGLYAAPRTIQVGQNISRSRLIDALLRAGYAESVTGLTNPVAHPIANIVWNGSFSQTEAAIEICPARRSKRPAVIRATFGGAENQNTISELTGDDLPLDSFTLEPEVLSNDLSYKTGKRETVRYSDLPPVLVQAILSIEDRRFFQHSGLDPMGIGRALLRNAGDERVGQGGSTITQQLVKNTYLTPERTLRRKYAEAMLAFALERRLTKQDIFALYCNEVYLGQRDAVAARGVREAAHIYFGKELKDLSLGEAATLAGMIQGPVRYSPVRHPEAAQQRRNLVLKSMVRDGWIDAAQSAELLPERVVVSPASVSNNSLAPFFVDYVDRTMETLGETVGRSHSESTDVSAASQRVYTTIDLDLQRLAESAIKKQLVRLDAVYKSRNVKPQAALVALDPRTGNVVAMVGGRDYARSQLNRVTDARRQPGSTFKPFVYAAALEDGMSPVQQFADAPREFVYDRNKIYRPANFGGGYSMRDVTMRDGLVRSLNTVTVDVAMQTGLARIANLAAQFGLPRPERYPSLALGTEEVTPLQLAVAYAAFVNGGRRVQPKVIAAFGEPLAAASMSEETNNETEQVISPTTAYMVTNMLSAVVDHGTARAARGAVKGTAIAGKTGTSRDGWFVGYTQNLVCVVWIGFDDNQQLGLTGAAAALPAWTDFMSAAIELRPELGGRNFECPEGINFVEIDADTGQRSTLTCPHRELIAVTPRLLPNLECFEHGAFPELKELAPENPRETENQTVLAQHARAPFRLVRPSDSAAAATRVDVDARGRRTLVNALR